jgi:hypothetical protein
MHILRSGAVHCCACLALLAGTVGLSGCGGSPAAASAPITQSTITLPSSVQVVSAK